MQTIAISKLRSNLMTIIKEIEQGSQIDITSHGKVVAKLVPPDLNKKEAKAKLAEIGKTAEMYDLISPIAADWEALN